MRDHAETGDADENLRTANFDAADFEYSVLERQDPVQTTRFDSVTATWGGVVTLSLMLDTSAMTRSRIRSCAC